MKVSEQIIQVIDVLCEKFGLAIDWTSENVIPYITVLCEKLVNWEIWSSVAWIGIMTVLSLVTAIIATKCRVFSLDFIDEWDVGGCLLCVAFVALWFATILCIGTQIFDIIKCYTFPEMFLFEYITNMINSTK